jgi:outer membrane autotransporter protein
MYLKQSLLAAAITTIISSQAFAVTVALDNSHFPSGQEYKGGLTLTGTQAGSGNAVTLNNSNILGHLVNQATISATGAGSVGLETRGGEYGDHYNTSDFGGDIINQGVVTASGEESDAVRINKTGAVSLYNTKAGQIIATGEGSTGLHLNGAQLTGVLQNDGKISGEGVGLDLDSDPAAQFTSTLGNIDNGGIIEGTGAGSRGMLIDGATFYDGTRALINSGIIKGEAIGINVDQYAMQNGSWGGAPGVGETITEKNLQILAEKGEISGGQYAILVEHPGVDRRFGTDRPNGVDLVLGNTEGRGTSTIRGNLQGLDEINVIGPAEFHGTSMQANRVEVFNGATLTLNDAHTTIDGKLNLLSGATLGLPLSADTQAGTPVLNVTGEANLASGSTVVINAKGSDFAKGGVDYDLISAQALNIAPDVTIKSSSALLTVDSSTLANGKLNVKVSTVGEEETVVVVENGGGSKDAQGAAKSFMSVAEQLGSSNPDDRVLKALIAAGDDTAAIARIAKQLTPEVNGGAASAAHSSITLVNNAIGSRSSGLRSGQSSGDALDGTGAWFQILNSQANQDVRSGVAGYDADSKGFALGADHKINDNTVLGVAYSYVKTNVDSDNGNKTDVENNTLTAYSTWTEGNWFVDGGLSYGKGKNDSKRYVSGTTAKGSYDSDMVGVNVMAGYGFHFDHAVVLEPRVAARYTNLSIDGFSEHGSSAALKTSDQRLEVGEIGAGVRLAGSFDLGKGTLEPEFKVMGYHDLIADKSSTTSAFTLGGTSFVATGVTPARDSYEVGVGADYKLGAVTLSGSYDRLMKTGFDADSFTAKVRYDF